LLKSFESDWMSIILVISLLLMFYWCKRKPFIINLLAKIDTIKAENSKLIKEEIERDPYSKLPIQVRKFMN